MAAQKWNRSLLSYYFAPCKCRDRAIIIIGAPTAFLIGNWDRGHRKQKLLCPLVSYKIILSKDQAWKQSNMTCTRTRIQIRQLAGEKRRKQIFSFGIGIEVAESRSCFVLSTPSTAARLFQYSIRPLQSSPIKLKLLHFTLIALNCALLGISAMAFCILLWVHLLRPKKYITIKNHLSRFKNRTGFHDIGESEFWARTALRKILSDFHIYIFRCSECSGKRDVLMLRILRF